MLTSSVHLYVVEDAIFEPFKYDIRSRTGKGGADVEVLGKEEKVEKAS